MEYKDYEFIDFQHTFNVHDFSANQERHIYIPRVVYDEQVNCGQETETKIRAQIDLDIPRSSFEVEGEEMTKYPKYMSMKMARYCTQTVMGLPVELLTRCGLVAEQKKATPLKIEVWGDKISARKKLRVLNNKKWIPIEVRINADMNDPCVIMILKT